MRLPQPPPDMSELMSDLSSGRLTELVSFMHAAHSQRDYLHWDKLRRLSPPDGITHREWWLLVKLSRVDSLRQIDLRDRHGEQFQFALPENAIEELHHIDLGAGGTVSLPEQIMNPQTRDRYLVSSLMEEAITSSQLEGAATTREVAKEMIRSGRKPTDISEQMILNNYITMQRVRELKSHELTLETVFMLHRLVTENTLDNPEAAGRYRTPAEHVRVEDDYGNVVHTPPSADELTHRMQVMCDFANGRTPDCFVHPAVRAIILHFWLAYDHPFVDGNGRTARALFYWAMLRNGYWMFEFISISNILRKAPQKYARSFLYTETDDNDLTYFLVAQTEVIRHAITELHAYINRKTEELRQIETHMRAFDLFNHRQVALIRHALKHPGQRYTFASHKMSHNIVYETARVDLLDLHECGILDKRKLGKKQIFTASPDLADMLLKDELKSTFRTKG